jgi:putative copper export protein
VKQYATITNNFLHDMATGTWFACLLVLLVLSGRRVGIPAEAAAALTDSMWVVFWLLVVALVVVTVTGAIRLAYWRAQTASEELAAKRKALIVKHIVFALVYGGGTVWAFFLVKQ